MKYKIICHRGINREKENTYESITDTIYLNNDIITYGVEFDIQITGDNNIICYHDDTLQRLHENKKRVAEITQEEINKFNLPIFYNIMEKLSSNKNLIIDVELKIYLPCDYSKLKYLCEQ